MKIKGLKYTLTTLLIVPMVCQAQWYIAPGQPSASRYDDVFFINAQEGWAVNSEGEILHTTDQGTTWNIQASVNKYLRSIEFVDQNLGFCGSLEGSFYKTTDGGNTWVDIANTITPTPPGICGISAPDANTIYGCGIWSSPAYIIKSTDGGNSWIRIDMSAYATALVDIEFTSPTEGFVVGTANPASNGGIILYTSDGGSTWTTKYVTNTSLDYVWKIQSPDGINYFASIDAVPVTNNLRYLKSTDSGNTWVMDTILNTFVYTQMIGFIDPNTGWIGANTQLYKTTNGGIDWDIDFVGNTYNRFFRVTDNLAFLSGAEIYRYGEDDVGISNPPDYDEVHELEVTPNPAHDFIHIDLTLHSKTRAQLLLLDMSGRVLETFLDENKVPSTLAFDYSVQQLSEQTLFLVLKTNEGLVYRKIVVN